MRLGSAHLTLSDENIKCICSRKEPEKKEKNYLCIELNIGRKA